jgi:hypothetical protein
MLVADTNVRNIYKDVGYPVRPFMYTFERTMLYYFA